MVTTGPLKLVWVEGLGLRPFGWLHVEESYGDIASGDYSRIGISRSTRDVER